MNEMKRQPTIKPTDKKIQELSDEDNDSSDASQYDLERD